MSHINNRLSKVDQPKIPKISDFYYAVYPLSVQFKQACDKNLYLQFEKNLQIILKFQLNSQPRAKGQVKTFQLPQKITHFRILNQKNLQYQWSLYSNNIVNQQNHEQFIESQKINYKSHWQEFKKVSKDRHVIQVQLKKIKCKLQYMFVMAKNLNQLLAITNNQYRQSIVSNRSSINQIKPNRQSANSDQNNRKSHQIPSKLSAITEVQGQLKKVEEDLRTSQQPPFLLSLESMKQSVTQRIPQLQNNNVQEIPSNFQTPQKNRLSVEQRPQSMKLSHSQIKISEQLAKATQNIQNSIIQQSNYRNSQTKQINIKQTQELTFGNPAQINYQQGNKAEQSAQKKQQAQIKLTSSTLLNDKGQQIVPFYKRKSTIMILIIIMLIVGTGLGLTLMKKSGEVDKKVEKNVQKPTKLKKQKQKVEKAGKKQSKKKN